MVESLQWFNLWKHLLDQRLGGSSDPLIWPYMLYNCCTTFILYNIYGDINIYTYINIHTCICTHTHIYIYMHNVQPTIPDCIPVCSVIRYHMIFVLGVTSWCALDNPVEEEHRIRPVGP